MKKMVYLLLAVLIIPFWGCDKEEENYSATYSMVIASEKRIANIDPTGGVYLAPCMMVKSEELFHSNEWTPFIFAIEGFQYEEGYEYTLQVKEFIDKSLADGGWTYRLHKVVSRVKKNSDGLPPDEKKE